ncbi:MAG: hypothetical protein COW24_03710 [Candidatus Kerfeldbacteria bacterium CG15_BIG_FIL_POST_REV_8_21_14_020_45_12]|uniref:N-acetyltransferase domain-containing protein n=1 Tax=Candidatus Kerfeldbacteria bacterium CG15_BIG_FIL_POST_REV_8_21_14_020_45_12 TaxID=2014247 RepID=A0A2M7H3F6_9BACT|nr:MAG: hypothetical protein COW24_03710 [Candidatus Kerfeldbacteria bacterium CG15_BIG_FIL_POST_REV_8_21_14_020_45_12]PJA93806.1 MAG: hypothetical protein CO132_01315 [Candidatus Kerfeldbacteria bacterium CG_4_9_14_3_um_filter_45_8]
MNYSVSPLAKADLDQLPSFLQVVISDTFKQDNIDNPLDEVEEIENKLASMKASCQPENTETLYLVAKSQPEDNIIGTIAYSKPNQLIKDHLKIDLSEVPEVSSVLILPTSQGQGIGSALFKKILELLKQRQVKSFCLDGGYIKSQGFWIKKLGKPDVVLTDYYGKGRPYMIWHRDVTSILEKNS